MGLFFALSLSLFVCLMHEDYLSVLWIYPVLLRGIKTLWSVNTIVFFSCYGYLALTTTTTTIWVFRYILWSVSVSLCMCVCVFICLNACVSSVSLDFQTICNYLVLLVSVLKYVRIYTNIYVKVYVYICCSVCAVGFICLCLGRIS